MEKKLCLKEMFNSYKAWVAHNPNRCTDLEVTLTWSSYFIASKLDNSQFTSELVYCLSKLLNLFNDVIIRREYGNEPQHNDVRDKIKMCLTIAHYCEVTIELLVKKKLGVKASWSVILFLQMSKCMATLFLLYKCKEVPVQYPPVKFLRRKEFTTKMEENSDNCFTLRRSGRLIRRVEGAPPLSIRDWQPVKVNSEIPNPDSVLYCAETIHTLKPFMHLAAMRVFGVNSWQQWIFSLGLDLSSLHMFNKYLKKMSNEQNLEINSRKLSLLLYLIRSPMYQRCSANVIEAALNRLSKTVPFASYVCDPLWRYLNNIQDVYFYLWSS